MPPSDELARAVVVHGSEITRLELGERWGKHRRGDPRAARLYAALQGGGELVLARRRLTLRAGELAFLPRADEHVFRDAPTTAVPRDGSACVGMHPIDAHVWADAAPTPRSTLVIVDLRIDDGDAPWRGLLAPVVHVTGEDRSVGRWLGDTLGLLAGAHDLSPALREGITTSWAHALFALALRAPEAALPGADALRDEAILAALARLRARPERPWELGALASEVGVSRSVLAARATALLGEPIGSYLRRLRIDRAADLLAATDAPIKVIASRVGYASEPAFTRAFTRALGAPPTAYRRARRELARAPA